MKIDNLTPDTAILKELGQRLARVRKQQGFSQTSLAQEAGLGVATLRRIEAGQDSQLESWLKLMKPLNMTHAIDALLPENFTSPMAQVKAGSKRRAQNSPSGSFQWGDTPS